jgi:hypothetical protein
MAYDAANLHQTAVLYMSPDGADGGIWQSGRGPAVDSAGAIYFETGNGTWNGTSDLGTSLLRLSVQGRAFSVDDYFTPHDYEALNARDADLGSTGPLLIPGANLLVAGSKKGIIYLFDTRKLGHLTPDDSGVLQTIDNHGGRMLAGLAYWDGPAGRTLYLWCEADFLNCRSPPPKAPSPRKGLPAVRSPCLPMARSPAPASCGRRSPCRAAPITATPPASCAPSMPTDFRNSGTARCNPGATASAPSSNSFHPP